MLHRLDSLLRRSVRLSCFALSIVVTILMVIEIVARQLFEQSFRGLPEIYLILVMWLYMLGAVLASTNRTHLRISLLDQVITSPSARRIYDLTLATLSLFILMMFIRWAWGLIEWGVKRPQTTPILHLPSLSSMLSIFVCSILVTIYGIRDFYFAVAAFRSPTKPEKE